MKKSVYANRHENLAADLAVLHAVRDKHGIKSPMGHRDIADAVGCSRSLICHIEQTALKKLRHPTRINQLREAI